jgi:hypothetical protein
MEGRHACHRFDSHDVPGELALLATARTTSQQDAVLVVSQLLAECSGLPDIRIEIEQVLFSTTEPFDQRPSFTAINDAEIMIPNCEMISDIPSYEIHLGLFSTDGSALPPAETLMRIAEEAGIEAEQLLVFASKPKAVFTIFFNDHEQLFDAVVPLSTALRSAVARLNLRLQLKTVAERILACVRPSDIISTI